MMSRVTAEVDDLDPPSAVCGSSTAPGGRPDAALDLSAVQQGAELSGAATARHHADATRRSESRSSARSRPLHGRYTGWDAPLDLVRERVADRMQQSRRRCEVVAVTTGRRRAPWRLTASRTTLETSSR